MVAQRDPIPFEPTTFGRNRSSDANEGPDAGDPIPLESRAPPGMSSCVHESAARQEPTSFFLLRQDSPMLRYELRRRNEKTHSSFGGTNE